MKRRKYRYRAKPIKLRSSRVKTARKANYWTYHTKLPRIKAVLRKKVQQGKKAVTYGLMSDSADRPSCTAERERIRRAYFGYKHSPHAGRAGRRLSKHNDRFTKRECK